MKAVTGVFGTIIFVVYMILLVCVIIGRKFAKK
jgi:hypothetical protein